MGFKITFREGKTVVLDPPDKGSKKTVEPKEKKGGGKK